MPTQIQSEANEKNILECQDVSEVPIARVDAAGTFITSAHAAPSNANLENGECAIWYDIANDYVMFRVRKNSTTYMSGSVKLS